MSTPEITAEATAPIAVAINGRFDLQSQIAHTILGFSLTSVRKEVDRYSGKSG